MSRFHIKTCHELLSKLFHFVGRLAPHCTRVVCNTLAAPLAVAAGKVGPIAISGTGATAVVLRSILVPASGNSLAGRYGNGIRISPILENDRTAIINDFDWWYLALGFSPYRSKKSPSLDFLFTIIFLPRNQRPLSEKPNHNSHIDLPS